METDAEAIILSSPQAIGLPDSVSFETGASLAIPGLTAAHVVFGTGGIAGKAPLIHGGNRNVVQRAVWGGARDCGRTPRPLWTLSRGQCRDQN